MKLVLAVALLIHTIPDAPLIEKTRRAQALNFDLVIGNRGTAALELTKIEATVLGENDTFVAQKRLASNGDSIATIPNRKVDPGKTLVVFNPFEFEPDLDLRAIRYDLEFGDEHATITVRPRAYETKTDLILPIRGRLFVHDGHDLLSHHRRLDVTGDMTTALGIRENMMRYAYDFVVIDAQGRMLDGMGTPILATGAGTVVSSANDREDSTATQRAPMEFADVLKDLTRILGNYVVIDHGNGEFSVFAHMKKGSVAVKAGDRVKQGQKIGEIGWSGDAMFPHLHYQLQRDAKFGEGLPSAFNRFRLLTGSTWKTVKRGVVDSGDVVETSDRANP